MSRVELEEKILACIDELRQANAEFEIAGRECAIAEVECSKAKATAILSHCGGGTKTTADERRAHTDKACAVEALIAAKAEALRDAQKEKVRSLQNELTAYQSLLASLRAEMAMAGMPERR